MLRSVHNLSQKKLGSLERGLGVFLALAVTLLMAVGLSACGDGQGAGDEDASDSDDKTIDVVAAFYPLAFLAEQVGGDLVTVTDLTPAGGHAHDLELSPRQVTALNNADIVVYLGQGFQPAVETAVLQSSSTSMDGMTFVDDEVLLSGDPHVWLDPEQMAAMGDALAEQLAAVDPEHADVFLSNAASLRGELEEIDEEYRVALSECTGVSFVTSHEAFGYMAQAYGLNQVGVMGMNPDAEPSPKRLRELEKVVEETGATTLFFEAQTASDTEEKMADALSLKVGHLETLESAPTSADDYLGALRVNLESLREGLDCAK